MLLYFFYFFFFFNDTATTEIYTLSLHDALPIYYDDYMEASTLAKQQQQKDNAKAKDRISDLEEFVRRFRAHKAKARKRRTNSSRSEMRSLALDRKSTRLNSSHLGISYAVFCLKK